MDPNLDVFKAKLRDALSLVNIMSFDGRIEAVTYWNELAEQFQDLVQRSTAINPDIHSAQYNHDSNYDQHSNLNSSITQDFIRTQDEAININSDNNCITCIETGYANNSLLELKSQINTQFESDVKIENPNKDQHTCNVCGKSGFSTKGNLKRHLKAHSGEKPFKCDYCDSCFTEKKSLKIHVRRHTGEKPYKCQICGKPFSQTGVLQSHMALHYNERKFDCQKCGKAFRQRSQLKLHLMRHDGVKRLECSTCFAKFLTKGDLERHCRIHTGERPYSCQICDKTFTRQQSLNEHMNRHTGRKPYDCKYCDKTFSEMSGCYKHAKTHKKQDQQVNIQNAEINPQHGVMPSGISDCEKPSIQSDPMVK